MGAHARERQIAQKRGLERLEQVVGARVGTPCGHRFGSTFGPKNGPKKVCTYTRKMLGFVKKGRSETAPFWAFLTPSGSSFI